MLFLNLVEAERADQARDRVRRIVGATVCGTRFFAVPLSLLPTFRRLPFGLELVSTWSRRTWQIWSSAWCPTTPLSERHSDALRKLWSDFPPDAWPPEVDLLSLRLVR